MEQRAREVVLAVPAARRPAVAGAYGKFESGLLLYKGGAPKPAWYGFRLPLVVKKAKGSRVALWGLVRPAHGRAGTLEIQVKDRSGGWTKLATQRYGGSGYWKRSATTKAGRQWRVEWTDPATGTQWEGSARRAPTRRCRRAPRRLRR